MEKIIGKFKIETIQDDSGSSNPREWDNLGTMLCFHRRYSLGDKNETYKSDDYSGWEEMKADIIKREKVGVILPLYLYDHSGITMSTSPFDCRWDSGQVGFIFISKKKIREEYSIKKITDEWIEKIKNYLIGEVKTYDQYLTGDVYGYEISEVSTCDKGHEHLEEVDSCWGFFGEKECMEEAEGVVKHLNEKL